LIFHSDQGSQFAALGFGQACRDARIAQSMGSKGCAYDNAVAESFFATLKKAARPPPKLANAAQADLGVFAYIEGFFNPIGRHSTLGMLSPREFENKHSETLTPD
jgi:putative transposase